MSIGVNNMCRLKKSIYLDTTIPSYLFDERKELKYPCDITKEWWKEESRNFNIFISVETIAELNSGDYPRKAEILDFIHNIKQLQSGKAIKDVALFYIKNKLMPNEILGDAIHLAYASYYKER